jgi:hypothetical protein
MIGVYLCNWGTGELLPEFGYIELPALPRKGETIKTYPNGTDCVVWSVLGVEFNLKKDAPPGVTLYLNEVDKRLPFRGLA